jgi:hypothetical protein
VFYRHAADAAGRGGTLGRVVPRGRDQPVPTVMITGTVAYCDYSSTTPVLVQALGGIQIAHIWTPPSLADFLGIPKPLSSALHEGPRSPNRLP